MILIIISTESYCTRKRFVGQSRARVRKLEWVRIGSVATDRRSVSWSIEHLLLLCISLFVALFVKETTKIVDD